MLRYLDDQGIRIGAEVHLIARQPFGGPLTVAVDGTEHILGGDLVAAMRIAAL